MYPMSLRGLAALLAGLLLHATAAAQIAAGDTETRAMAAALARENISHLMPFATDPVMRDFLTEDVLPHFDLDAVIAVSAEAYLDIYSHEELVFLRDALADPVARGVLLKFNEMSLAVSEPVNALLIDAIRCTPLGDRPPQMVAYGEHPPGARAEKCAP